MKEFREAALHETPPLDVRKIFMKTILNYIQSLLISVLSLSCLFAEDDLSKDLELAAYKGNISKIKELISKGADVNHLDDNGCTPLLSACTNNDIKSVKLLIEAGANVDYQMESGLSALMQASCFASLDIVRLLVEEGKADIELKGKTGTTAVYEALMKGRYATANYLLDLGADCNIAVNTFPIVYHFIQVGDAKAIEMLIVHGVNLNVTATINNEEQSPTDFAKYAGQENLIDVLKKKTENISSLNFNNIEEKLETSGYQIMTTGKIVSVENSRLILDVGEGNQFIYILHNDTELLLKTPGAKSFDVATVKTKNLDKLLNCETVTITTLKGLNLAISVKEGGIVWDSNRGFH